MEYLYFFQRSSRIERLAQATTILAKYSKLLYRRLIAASLLFAIQLSFLLFVPFVDSYDLRAPEFRNGKVA